MPASMALDHILKTRVRCTHFKQKRTCERNSSNDQQQWWRHQSTKLTRKRYTIPLSKGKAHQAGCGTRSDQK